MVQELARVEITYDPSTRARTADITLGFEGHATR